MTYRTQPTSTQAVIMGEGPTPGEYFKVEFDAFPLKTIKTDEGDFERIVTTFSNGVTLTMVNPKLHGLKKNTTLGGLDS